MKSKGKVDHHSFVFIEMPDKAKPDMGGIPEGVVYRGFIGKLSNPNNINKIPSFEETNFKEGFDCWESTK